MYNVYMRVYDMNRNSIWRKMPRCLWKPCTAETSLRLNQDSMQLMHQVWMWRQCGWVLNVSKGDGP